MAFVSSSTLQQDDNVAAVAGSGGGAVGITREDLTGAISSFRPGSVPKNAILFSRVQRNLLQVEDLFVLAGTAPASDFSFSIELGSKTQNEVLLAGETRQEFPVGETVAPDDEIRVTGASTADSDLADVRCSFKVSLI